MAINAQKFLAPSKNYGIIKSTVAAKGGALVSIEKKVIRIDELIQSNLVLYKKNNALAKREDENKQLEDKEKELEKEKPKALKGIKTPKLPGFGFLGWIKNWIFNTLLGFVTVRLIDHLPKMIKFAAIADPVMENILNFSGVLLNGMISFIDAGYKAVDATRGLIGKTFGEDGIKNFDMLSKKLTEFMNLAIIVGMASSDFGFGKFGKKSGAKTAAKSAAKIGSRGAERVATRAGAKVGGKLGAKIGSKILKAIPFVSTAIAVVEGAMRLQEGDPAGALLSFGTAIPVLGWGFLGADILRETGSLKFAGGGYVRRYANGGSVSTRTLTKKPTKRKVSVAPQKVKAGSDVGGEKNLITLFPRAPKNKENTTPNPLGYLEGASKTLGKTPAFGPLFDIAIKTVLGNKPSPVDYKNAGIVLSNWISNNFMNVGRFAGGGEVDQRMLQSGKDMSDAIAKTIETTVSSEVDKVINDLMRQLMMLEEIKPGQQPPTPEQPTQPGEMTPGSVPGGQLTVEQLVGLAKGAGFSEQEAVIMAAIALAESGGGSNKLNNNPSTGDLSYGLWQINMIDRLGPERRKQFGISNNEQLFDPVTNAKAAYIIKQRQGFSAWSVYKSGTYKGFIGKAQAAKGAPSLATSPMMATLGTAPGNLQAARALAQSMGLQLTSHYRPGDAGYHGSGRAMDFSNDSVGRGTPQQLAYAKKMVSTYGSSLKQLIYTPLGYGIANGKQVPLSYWGNKVNSQHYHHVHVAFAKGGRVVKPMMALIGEKGQEFIFDADTTRGLDQMKPGLLDHLNAAKTKRQLADIIKTYDDEPEIVMIPIPMPSTQQQLGGGGAPAPVISVNSQDNSWMFDRLATGTG